MAPRKKTVPENEFFFTTFAGEYVRIITNVVINETLETEEGIANTSQPMIVEGFLLEFDDSFLYLGTGPGNVTHSVSKRCVSIVQVGEEQKAGAMYDEILEAMPDPEKDGDIN